MNIGIIVGGQMGSNLAKLFVSGDTVATPNSRGPQPILKLVHEFAVVRQRRQFRRQEIGACPVGRLLWHRNS